MPREEPILGSLFGSYSDGISHATLQSRGCQMLGRFTYNRHSGRVPGAWCLVPEYPGGNRTWRRHNSNKNCGTGPEQRQRKKRVLIHYFSVTKHDGPPLSFNQAFSVSPASWTCHLAWRAWRVGTGPMLDIVRDSRVGDADRCVALHQIVGNAIVCR